jgi:hypothetical protein
VTKQRWYCKRNSEALLELRCVANMNEAQNGTVSWRVVNVKEDQTERRRATRRRGRLAMLEKCVR